MKRRFRFSRRVGLILLGLTGVFLIDDVLVILLVRELQLISLSGTLYWLIGLLVLILNFSLALVVWRALRTRPVTGREGLIGKRGTALSALTPGREGRVKVAGEIWHARSKMQISRGAPVEVIGVEGLTLVVKRNQDAATNNGR